MTSACFYNIAYFQDFSNPNGNITVQYEDTSQAIDACMRLGSETCGRLCSSTTSASEGNTDDWCYLSCMDLSAEAVQPLCWRGIGSLLMSVGNTDDCGALASKKRVVKAHLRECLLLCSGASCSRSSWQHCVEGFLSSLLILNSNILTERTFPESLCLLLEDPFMTHWCYSKLDAFEISAKSQTPQIGTYALEHNVLQNQTLRVAHTGESSRIRLCLDEGDLNSCQCIT